MKEQATLSPLLRKRELAFALGLTIRGVDSLRARRVIPSIKISSRCVRFDLEKVRAALAKREVTAI